MNTSPIHEFPVAVECPKNFIPSKVWVRELISDHTRFIHVNGCDSYCGDSRCRECCVAVHRQLTQGR